MKQGCVHHVKVSSVAWGMTNDGYHRCDDAWCDLPDEVDSVTSLLLNATSSSILYEESSPEFHLYSTSGNRESCNKTAVLPKDKLVIIRSSTVERQPKAGSLAPSRDGVSSMVDIGCRSVGLSLYSKCHETQKTATLRDEKCTTGLNVDAYLSHHHDESSVLSTFW